MSLQDRLPSTQAYPLNQCLFALKSNADFRKRYAADAAQALQEFPLTLEERAAVQQGDQERLLALGAHPYLALLAQAHSVRTQRDHNHTYS